MRRALRSLRVRFSRWRVYIWTCQTCGNDIRTGRCECPEDYASLH